MSARSLRRFLPVAAVSSTLAILASFPACSAADGGGDVIKVPGQGGGQQEGGTGGAIEGGAGETGVGGKGDAGGAAGQAGSSGGAGSAGAAGTAGAAGSGGGNAGAGGTAGSAGSAGGTAGSAGEAGAAGTSGSGGAGGTAGSAGSAGSAGTAGTAGSGGCGTVEVCDGLDNNCNSEVDEGNPGGGATCQTGEPGVCASGKTQCISGSLQCVQNTLPSAEACDGLDNSCDGQTDEGNPGGGVSCQTAMPGICSAGVTQCLGGSVQCVQQSQPTPETCDSLDNDCDGMVDDGDPGGGAACDTGLPGACKAGSTHCIQGVVQCQSFKQPASEICDGIDNDCNSEIDDGSIPGVGVQCIVMGQPAGTPCSMSTSMCTSGQILCPQTFFPSSEICDGQDNNCNGSIDEGAANALCSAQYPQAVHVASWACSSSGCSIAACASNASDVNGQVADGCECSAATWGASCAAATAQSVPLNTPLGTPISISGTVGTANGSAWFLVNFAKPALGTPYHFRIVLADSHSGEYGMNVRTACTGFASCSDGANRGQDATIWEVVTSYLSHPVDSPAQPSSVYVEVFRKNGAVTCNSFTIALSNY